MHTTLNLNNLFFIARQTALDDKLKDNFKQLTNPQRKTLAKIFKSYKTFRKDPSQPIKFVSQKVITDITNNLSGVGRKRKEGCWKNFKRFLLSLFGFRISTSSIQKRALQLPPLFSKHQSFTLETTLELEKDMHYHGLQNDEDLTRQLFVDWKRVFQPLLFIIKDASIEPIIMNPDILPCHYENLIPDELKALVKHDKASIRRIATFLTQSVGVTPQKIIATEYLSQPQTRTYFKFYFKNNNDGTNLQIEMRYTSIDENGNQTDGEFLTVQTIDLKNLDSPIILDVYSNL